MVILYTGGCVKEEFSPAKLDTSLDIDPALATPLGYFNFRLGENPESIRNLKISSNSERILCLNYSGEITSEPAGELFRFDIISERFSFSNPINSEIDLSAGSYEMKFSTKVPVFLSNTGMDADLDSVIMSSGLVSISETQFPDAGMDALIVIPGLKYNGNSFQINPLAETGMISTDISGYVLELSSEEEKNNLIDIDILISFPRQNIIISDTESIISFNFDFNIREWLKISGYLGQENINLGQNHVNVELNNTLPEIEFFFADPKLWLKTLNSFSIPVGLGVPQLIAEYPGSESLIINGAGVPIPPEYFFPAYPEPDNSLMEIRDSILLDSENSNLVQIISSSPERIIYQVELLTNPGDNKIKNTIYSESRFSANLELELPFHGSGKSLSLKDTIPIDLSGQNFPMDETIQNVIFRFYYENSYPVEISIRLYFADENFMVIDTLFNSFIKGADPVNILVNDPAFVSGQAETLIPGNKLEHVMNARYIIGDALLSTREFNKNVKIFDNQGLKVFMGVIFDIKAKDGSF